MGTLNAEDVERIVQEYQAQKITGDMLDGLAMVDALLNYEQPKGIATPWPGLQDKFEIRPGELSLIAGANGSGKSMLVGQMVAWAMAEGRRSFIASFEMRPRETARRMIAQCAGGTWTREFAEWWGNTYRELIWTWDIMDVVKSHLVLERVEAVSEYLKSDIVVIDSLLKCGLPQDSNNGYQAQADFVDRLQHAAKHLGVHIFLVVHLRKPERGVKSGKYDIRGASQISDLADNVLLLRGNDVKREAEQLLETQAHLTRDQERALSEPDAVLEVAKQRHGAWEGILRLDFHKPSLQFRPVGHVGRYAWPGAKGVWD